MRFLVIGLGSMGKRRVRNLRHLGASAVAGFDPRQDRRDEASAKYGIDTHATIDTAFAWNPDAVVISTPPDLHTRYALDAVRRGLPCFTEASVLDDGMEELAREAAARDVVVAPSCTMRYFAGPRLIREWLGAGVVGTPFTFVYHSGQWLPDWHPWEDYRTFYVSRRTTGACREIVPFELTWLTDIFGDVTSVQALRAKRSALEADIDDVYQCIFEFSSGTSGLLQVDVLARAPVRHFRLLGAEGTIEWDAVAKEARVFRTRDRRWETVALTLGTVQPDYVEWAAEEPYVDEMRDFMAAAEKRKAWSHPLDADRRLLEVLVAAEQSHDTGRRVEVS